MALAMSPQRRLQQRMYAMAGFMLATIGPEAQKILYYPRGGAALTLRAEAPGRGEGQMQEAVGSRFLETQRTFKIPRQPVSDPIFPPAGGCMGEDVIEDEDGTKWRVQTINNPDGVGGVWTIVAVSTKVKRSGQTGGVQ